MNKILSTTILAVASVTAASCQSGDFYTDSATKQSSGQVMAKALTRATSNTPTFYVGADLSYTNELEDTGVEYTVNGEKKDLFTLFSQNGANMVRLRLWHNPTWTNYSNYADVKKSAKRIKKAGMSILLDFHYSDSWTDPEKNIVPAAWASVVNDTTALADSVYNYTYKTLLDMKKSSILPAAVQIGNETNNNIMVSDNSQLLPLNVKRNVKLFNAGIKAVQDFNKAYRKNIKTVLHVALTNTDVLNWVHNVKSNAILNFDIIGVSYYPQWQFYTPAELGVLASTVYNNYGIQLLVAETGHIWTRSWDDQCHNLMSNMAPGYPQVPCPQLQKDFLIEVKNAVRNNHGYGVLAWEPGWVSSTNETLWGTGSNWENVAFFDFNNELLPHGGMDFLNDNNGLVTFTVDMTAAGESAKGYITGDFTTNGFGNWQIIPMTQVGSTRKYTFSSYLSHGQTVEYFYLSDSAWTARETVPESKRVIWNDRGYTLSAGTESDTLNDTWVNP
ncbi:MAG: glycosyl hydrolase 53 family protein [Prevotella sp.]|nr:glycosyl hydrolase 53 family protein [Prevotella sp.]